MTIEALVIDIAGWWLIVGAIVSGAFLSFGIDRIDEDARGAYAFRPLLIPAILLIWPLVLWRWIKIEARSEEWLRRYQPPRAAHLPLAILLAAGLGFAVIAGLSVQQTWPSQFAPERLSEVAQ
ncbi:MAG: hypothetical protein AAF681_06595 [Pseudomonadota bacterium]